MIVRTAGKTTHSRSFKNTSQQVMRTCSESAHVTPQMWGCENACPPLS